MTDSCRDRTSHIVLGLSALRPIVPSTDTVGYVRFTSTPDLSGRAGPRCRSDKISMAHAAWYSAKVWRIRSATDNTFRTPDVEWPALQMSRQRVGPRSHAPTSMSLLMSMAPRSGKELGIEPCGDDRRPQHIGLQACERAREKNVVGAARHKHVLVALVGHALVGGDKSGAHVGEIASERPGGPQSASIADAAGENDWSREETSDGAGECERVQPAGLAPSARRQQHQPVGSCLDRPLGVTDARDVGEDQSPGVVKRAKDGGAGDPTLVMTSSGAYLSTILRSSARRAFERCTIRFGQTGAQATPVSSARRRRRTLISSSQESNCSALRQFAVGKRTDDPMSADCDHQIDPRNQKHRRCNERQDQALRKAREAVLGVRH